MPAKKCFLNTERPCDLTCKAAFEVDDPVDNVDCSFVWLSFHAGEALFELRGVLENFRGGPGGAGSGKPPTKGGGPFSGYGGPKPPPSSSPPTDN